MGFADGLGIESEREGDTMDDCLISRWMVGPF